MMTDSRCRAWATLCKRWGLTKRETERRLRDDHNIGQNTRKKIVALAGLVQPRPKGFISRIMAVL